MVLLVIITVMLEMEDPVINAQDHALVDAVDVVAVLDAQERVLENADQDVIQDALADVVVLVLTVALQDALLVLLHVMAVVEFALDAQQHAKVAQDALMAVILVVRTYVVEHVQQNAEMAAKLDVMQVALRAVRISVFPHVQEPA